MTITSGALAGHGGRAGSNDINFAESTGPTPAGVTNWLKKPLSSIATLRPSMGRQGRVLR
jgi:hypothetical protein